VQVTPLKEPGDNEDGKKKVKNKTKEQEEEEKGT
jgi:hypothetical protein